MSLTAAGATALSAGISAAGQVGSGILGMIGQKNVKNGLYPIRKNLWMFNFNIKNN